MRNEIISEADMTQVLAAAIEVGQELAGIKRFGYPSIGGNLERAVDALRPYNRALVLAIEPDPGKDWIIRLLQAEPK